MRVNFEISAGELIDRMTILELKSARLPPSTKPLANAELLAARTCYAVSIEPTERLLELTAQLRRVNLELWETEEHLRRCEQQGSFDEVFVELARSVYTNNDRRAAIKLAIDRLLSSEHTELKSHPLPEVP